MIPVLCIFIIGIRHVKPTQRGIVERKHKYHNFLNPGYHWINPIFGRLIIIDVGEQIADILPQRIITNDNLIVKIDAQVCFKVKADEESVKEIFYNINNYKMYIINLARVILRNLISPLSKNLAKSEYGEIDKELFNTLYKRTMCKGIEIVRVELKEVI